MTTNRTTARLIEILVLFAALTYLPHSGYADAPQASQASSAPSDGEARVKGDLYEVIPPLRSAPLLTAPMRAGKGFKVDENIGSNGYFNSYTMRSDYGIYEIESTSELRQRIREIEALNQLAEFTSSKVFIDAAGQAGKNVILAPVHAAKAVANAVADPGETYEKVKKVPAGVLGFFGEVKDTVSSTSRTVSRSIFGSSSSSSSSKAGSDSKSNEKKSKSAQDLVVDTSVDAALGYVGYSKAQAAWYEKLQLDPYTTNKPLRERISQIASIESAVKLGFKFVPGVMSLGLLGTATKALDMANRLALYADPKELKNRNLVTLREMGVSTADSEAFFKAPGFSPLLATIVVDGLVRCGNVPGRLDLIKAIAETQTRPGAVFYAESLQRIATIRGSGTELKQLLSINRLPAAVLSSGEVRIVLPVDYVFWTAGVAKALASYPSQLAARGITGPINLELSGIVSDRTAKELKARGMGLRTGVVME